MTTLRDMTDTDQGGPVVAYSEFQRVRNLSQRTIRRRKCTLAQFERYIAPLGWGQVSGELVEEWLGLIPHAATRAAYRSDLSSFYRWAVRRRIFELNPMEDVESVRVPRGLPRPVDPDAIRDLVRYAPDDETRCAVALAAYAGLRLFEIAAITTDDLSLNSKPPVLVVRQGKGNRDRIVPLHPELVVVLRRCPAGPICGHTTGTIGRKVKAHLSSFGFTATTHALRHTFGTEAARASNGNLLVVRDLLGHSSPETTVRYTAFAAGSTMPTVLQMYGGVA